MRPVHWLHISDLHLHETQSEPQNAVLTALLSNIKRRKDENRDVDFVLVTGDLAFSGQESEYELVGAFFQDLATAIGISHEQIFCVPGNHDIDRNRQEMCFDGTRRRLQNQSEVYSFLSNVEERNTLLLRQESFRRFQNQFFVSQPREMTNDDLGYVSIIDVDEIRIAIIGLNTAWLATGGQTDNLQLLLGEKQVSDAIRIANGVEPHVIIGMAHHPFNLLRDFDRMPVQRLLHEECHFFHHGHKHIPDASTVISGSSECLTLACGASFESRETHNSYTEIIFDPLRAKSDVTFIQYDPHIGDFSLESNRTYTHRLDNSAPYDVGSLSSALSEYCPHISHISYYVAAFLVGHISEVPIQSNSSIVFGSVDILDTLPDNELRNATVKLLSVRNALRLLYGTSTLQEILANNGQPVQAYGAALQTVYAVSETLAKELQARNANARLLAKMQQSDPYRHTSTLMDKLLATEDWTTLRIYAERHLTNTDPATALKAKRYLALCLAQSTEDVERQRAIRLFGELISLPDRQLDDYACLATLLTDDGRYNQAKTVVVGALELYPDSIKGFADIGMKIVQATGDLDFRDRFLRRPYDKRAT